MFGVIRRKRAAMVVAVVAVLAIAGAAFAYFTSTGTGTGSAAVGNATNWTVTPGAATGTMYPGGGSASIPYTVTNGGAGNQQLSNVSASVDTDPASGDVMSGNPATPVSGCLASWFTAVANQPTNPTLPADLGPGDSATGGTVTVTMSDSQTNQDACKNVTPNVTIGADAQTASLTVTGAIGNNPISYSVAPTGQSGTLNPFDELTFDPAGHVPASSAEYTWFRSYGGGDYLWAHNYGSTRSVHYTYTDTTTPSSSRSGTIAPGGDMSNVIGLGGDQFKLVISY